MKTTPKQQSINKSKYQTNLKKNRKSKSKPETTKPENTNGNTTTRHKLQQTSNSDAINKQTSTNQTK